MGAVADADFLISLGKTDKHMPGPVNIDQPRRSAEMGLPEKPAA